MIEKNSKFQIPNSKNIFLSLIALLAGLIIANHLLLSSRALAQSATDEAEVVEAEGMEEKIEEIREKVEKEVEEKIETLESEKRAFFGQVTDLFNQTIVLETDQGKKTTKLDEKTTIVDQNRKKITFEDLEIDSFLITMGYLEAPEKLLAKRIVVSPKPQETNRIAVIGKVKEIKTEEESLIFESLKEKENWQVTTSVKTKITQKTQSGIEEIDFEQIREEALIVVVGTFKKEKEIEAKLIHLLTPTEEISPTPKAED